MVSFLSFSRASEERRKREKSQIKVDSIGEKIGRASLHFSLQLVNFHEKCVQDSIEPYEIDAYFS